MNHYIFFHLSFQVKHKMDFHMELIIIHYEETYYLNQNQLFLYFFYYLIIDFLVLNLYEQFLIYINILNHLLFVDKIYMLHFHLNVSLILYNQIILFLKYIPLLNILNLKIELLNINELYYCDEELLKFLFHVLNEFYLNVLIFSFYLIFLLLLFLLLIYELLM